MAGQLCPSEKNSLSGTSYYNERIPILGLITGSNRVVSAIHNDNKTVNGITSYYANFYVNNTNNNLLGQNKHYINSGSPSYWVNLSLNIPQNKRPFLANTSYYKIFDDDLIIGMSLYHDPDNNPTLPAFVITGQLSIKILSESLERHANDMIAINTLGQVDLVACSTRRYFRCERRTPDTYTKHLVVGYRQTAQNINIFPTFLHYSSRTLGLESVLYVVNDRTRTILNQYPSWKAEDNTLRIGGRQLLEDEFKVNTEILSGNEHGHEDKTHLFSFNEDGTIQNYAIMDYFDSKFNLYDSINQLVNSIDFDVLNPDYLHTSFIDGKNINFITKENNTSVDRFAEECLSAHPEKDHRLLIENNNFIMKANGETVWIKYPDKTNPTCFFPSKGLGQLNINQKLIQFNDDPINENEITYLLSQDKTKIIIKDGTVLKVVSKESFEKANGNLKVATPIQTFQLN
jgi:hypothetical protein